MKFITEEDLRDIYKKEPFTTYEIEPGTRLTPGAKQFLADRGMNMFDDEPFIKNYVVTISDDRDNAKAGKKPEENKAVAKRSWREEKLISKLRTAEAKFLATGRELLKADIFMAQSLAGLGKHVHAIKEYAEGNVTVEGLVVKECTGMKEGDFSLELEDCFEITDFHMQLDNGKELLSLHILRCELREVIPYIEEYCDSAKCDKLWAETIFCNLNKVINSLSQMICTAVGGKECQKKV